jgi:hypothetical protein
MSKARHGNLKISSFLIKHLWVTIDQRIGKFGHDSFTPQIILPVDESIFILAFLQQRTHQA